MQAHISDAVNNNALKTIVKQHETNPVVSLTSTVLMDYVKIQMHNIATHLNQHIKPGLTLKFEENTWVLENENTGSKYFCNENKTLTNAAARYKNYNADCDDMLETQYYVYTQLFTDAVLFYIKLLHQITWCGSGLILTELARESGVVMAEENELYVNQLKNIHYVFNVIKNINLDSVLWNSFYNNTQQCFDRDPHKVLNLQQTVDGIITAHEPEPHGS